MAYLGFCGRSGLFIAPYQSENRVRHCVCSVSRMKEVKFLMLKDAGG